MIPLFYYGSCFKQPNFLTPSDGTFSSYRSRTVGSLVPIPYPYIYHYWQKVPLSCIFHWKFVPFSHISFRKINRQERRSSGHFRKTFNWLHISPPFLLKSVLFLTQPAQLQTTTVCYINRFGPDQKRRTADSFVVNKPSVSPKKRSNRLVNFKAVDRSLTSLWWRCKR